MKTVKIALMGFTFANANKGCEALTYSFINILRELKVKDLEIFSFGYTEIGKWGAEYPEIKFHSIKHKMKSPRYWIELKKMFDQMDCIFDITFGDGFSDIYGKKWNTITNFAKQISIYSKAPLVLLPQTYGPYYNSFLKKWALTIIKKSDVAFSRDLLSAEEVNKEIGSKVISVTDLAFGLPYDSSKYHIEKDGRICVGINISGLLWNQGHSDTIKLSFDYQNFCRSLIKHLLRLNYTIHLIPHVIDNENAASVEDDVVPCKILGSEFPNVELSPVFENAIDAKSYISNMDVFIGARMHSTIAAFSSGVVTIPVSYSKKFEGLFGTLNYPYIVSCVKQSEEDAINSIIEYIEQRDALLRYQKDAMKEVNQKLNQLKNAIKSYIR